jgi:hypothetical protein
MWRACMRIIFPSFAPAPASSVLPSSRPSRVIHIHIYTIYMSGNLAIFKGHQQNGGEVNRGGGGLLASSPPSNHNQSTIEQKADGSTPRASLELLSIRTPRGSLPVKPQQGLTRFPRLTRAQGGGSSGGRCTSGCTSLSSSNTWCFPHWAFLVFKQGGCTAPSE